MFDTFQDVGDARQARRMALSTGASLALMGLLALAVLAAARGAQHVIAERRRVDVVFRPPPPPAEAAPAPKPPPPPARPKATPKPRPEPVVAAPAALVAPKELPQDEPPEADAAAAVAAAPVAVGGTGALVAGARVAGDGERADPVNLPENAQPPRELATNRPPDYPADARRQGREGRVVLKIVVEADGHVSRVSVMRGEEPFVSAAVAAVQRWRYEPARVDGQPITVFRIVTLPFRLD